jgi:hypothetical protein
MFVVRVSISRDINSIFGPFANYDAAATWLSRNNQRVARDQKEALDRISPDYPRASLYTEPATVVILLTDPDTYDKPEAIIL